MCVRQVCVHQVCVHQVCVHQVCVHQVCVRQVCIWLIWCHWYIAIAKDASVIYVQRNVAKCLKELAQLVSMMEYIN